MCPCVYAYFVKQSRLRCLRSLLSFKSQQILQIQLVTFMVQDLATIGGKVYC